MTTPQKVYLNWRLGHNRAKRRPRAADRQETSRSVSTGEESTKKLFVYGLACDALAGAELALIAKTAPALTITGFRRDGGFDAEPCLNLDQSFTDPNLIEAKPDMSKLYTEKFLPKR